MRGLRRRAQQRALEKYRRAVSRPLRQPSYTYKRLELTRTVDRLEALGQREPVWRINDKDDAHRWAQGLGLRVPALVGVHDRVEDVPWDDLPDRVVLKPCHGSTSRGVYLLERRGDVWWDLALHREAEPAGIVADFSELVRQGSVGPDVLVEELVRDPRFPDRAPVDYKVHTFYGTVGMIEAKAHGGPGAAHRSSWRVFDAQWRDLGNVFHVDTPDSSIPPPVHGDQLLDLARRASLAVPRAYLRVDLFEDADGPLLGEITPMPGNPLLVLPHVDRVLGELWEEAETRLLVRGYRAGLLSPHPGPAPNGFPKGLAPPAVRAR